MTLIRLIEFLCRYRYISAHQSEEKPLVFDAIGSKSEIVANAGKYLSKLDQSDFGFICEVLDAYLNITAGESIAKPTEFAVCQEAGVKNNSTSGFKYVCHVKMTEPITAPKPENIFLLFVKSFSKETRENLLHFYSCDDQWLTEKIYDEDSFFQYAVKPDPGEKFSYYTTSSGVAVTLIGGYNIGVIKQSIELCKKEPPAYYSVVPKHKETVVRPFYLYESINKELSDKKEVCFFLTNSKATINLPGGKDSHFALSKYCSPVFTKGDFFDGFYQGKYEENNNTVYLRNRTDAYIIKNKESVSSLENEDSKQ